ncbi:MAG: hypothetical protein IPM79_10505 [Polyangiaceae bacterium]|nr:hypothetical protein [Polyangiaceae bacterium]MBK8938053.1 hypothetical protein [Polyangiaceae bacterium]
MVEHLPTSDERWAELGPRLVVVVRPAIYEGAYAAALVRAPIAPLLYVYAAVDDGDSLRLLRADEAGSLAASHAEVLAAGIRNLEERGARLLGPEQSNEGREVLLVESGDGLESSRLVVPGWLAALTQGKEPAVAAAPTWTTLFVAPRPDEAALADLMDLAEEAWAGSGHPLSPVLYTTSPQGELVPLALPAEHPLSARLASLHARFAAAEYERQREVLELGLQGHEDAPLVGECRVLPHPAGGSVTAATFLAGVPSLLPRADVVFVAWREGDAGRYLLVERTDLERLAPLRLRPLSDLDPPRLATLGFPDQAELAALEAVALAHGTQPEQPLEDEPT